jgi:hypothetical protein
VTDRRVLLEERPVAVGAAWARAVCDSISREGRVIAGGWPGTIVEARARIANHLYTELSERRMKALDPEELEHAANVTYMQAKQQWLEVERRSKRNARAVSRDDD